MKKSFPLQLFLFSWLSITLSTNAAPFRKWDFTAGGSRYNLDYSRDVAVLSSGSSIVVGDREGLSAPNYYSDISVVKYDRDGNQTGIYSLDLFAQNQDEETIKVLVKEPYIYVLGTAVFNNVTSSDKDIFILKLDTSLNYINRNSYNGLSLGASFPNDVAIDMGMDMFQNIYIVGSTQRTASGTDMVWLKYDSGLTLLETKFNTSSGAFTDVPAAMKVSPLGYCYIAATKYDAAKGNRITGMKYAANGVKIWEKYHDVKLTLNLNDEAAAISYDPATEDIYITGRGENSSGDYDWAVVKFDGPTGTRLWYKRFAGLSAYAYDRGVDISYFNSGALYVCGNLYGTSGGSNSVNMILKKLDPLTGSAIWSKTFSGPSNEDDYCSSLLVSPSGTAYVMGTSERIGFGNQNYFIVLKYSSSGTAYFTDSLYYTLGACSFHSTYALKGAYNTALDQFTVVGRYLACTTSLISKWVVTSYTTSSFRQSDTEALAGDSRDDIMLFPNPASSVFVVQSDEANDAVIVRDISGRIIFESGLPSDRIEINASDWSRGLYSVTIRRGERYILKKLILQ